jgi:lipopolysaccharide export system permease protein
VEKKGADGSHIYGVKIYDHTDHEGNIKIMSADSGLMTLSPSQRNIIFTLYNGYNYTDIVTGDNYKKVRSFERMSFKQEQIKFSLKEFDLTRSSEDMYKSSQQMMNVRQLSAALDSLGRRFDERQEAFTLGFTRRWGNYNSIGQEVPATADKALVHDSIPDTIMTLQWPLLDNFTEDERRVIVEMSLASARNAKDNASFNKIDLKSQKENIKKHKKEWHKKFTLSIACIIFFFIGAPLGSIIRKGGLGLPVVISVLFFVVYYVISTLGERMAVFGQLNMFLGVWISSIILTPIGLFLTFKATTDAALFDGDSWKKFFQKLFGKRKKPEADLHT